ncbi:MAG: hypothetical protein A3A33_01125 [Candidatus Yanofskybacteria bacterium RIFCSPLOWO2_01_FULL_49_25]|uniref:RNA polymerase sigma factor n=1 Tax=Candidatus Yanofskybacteria bacterium RIFCSPLOWO2_01_FULL_49_25 TaxID=1802701 RepID=A0A1F8GVE1_9BACT|nr:MAG: hypothetical protein A3A33_01125 [Candidatus Yanofskybacteria bacterium RIFCSPLOWO2_01_FULL_49_25]
MDSHEERQFIEKAQCGDREALGALWDALTPKLFGYLVNVLKDKTLAEDILQTTWLKAIDGLPRFQQRGVPFSSWLFAIAHNECRQHWRTGSHEVPLDPEIHDIPDHASTKPHDKILIDQVLAKLPEDDRELLRLRYIADLPLSDIASILKLNFVTVRVRVHRALARARMHAVAQPNHA